MSGIAGMIRFDGGPADPALLQRMAGAVAHRGPDGNQHWVRGSVALGHCQLRTTPESLEEAQPLANEDQSVVLVMDGWLSNWGELRRELLSRGAQLRSRSDPELVLRAYEIWGEECLTHIDGDFAMAIWDARRRELICARDRLGNKPFIYHWSGTTLTFASEMHAVLDVPWVPRVPNEGMLAEFLACEWHARDETLWKDVMRLVPSHRLRVGFAGPHVERYWSPDLDARLPYRSDEEYIEHYRHLFTDCVRRASRSQAPVAFEVSGGHDSSAVFCAAEHLRRDARLLAPAMRGYTLAFPDEGRTNDLPYARAVGAFLGVNLAEVPPSQMPLAWYEARARRELDFPGFPNAAMSIGMRQQMSADGCRVVLTGEGGDEYLTAGPACYAEALTAWRPGDLSGYIRDDVRNGGAAAAARRFIRGALVPVLPPRMQDRLVSSVNALRGRISKTPLKPQLFWLAPQMVALLAARRLSLASRSSGAQTFAQIGLIEAFEDAMSDHVMENAERLAALHHMETRYPMRSAAFVQFAMSTPDRLRLRNGTQKYIHMEALHKILPEEVSTRRDKAEFSAAFRGHLDCMKSQFAVEIPRRRSGWFRSAGLGRLYEYSSAAANAGWPLWALWSAFGCDCAFGREKELPQQASAP